MALLYFNNQLIATSSLHGVLFDKIIDKPFNLKYKHEKGKFHTVIIYDDLSIHFLKINVLNSSIKKGDFLVMYEPFIIKKLNYDAVVNIYEQPSLINCPTDDFDMERFIKANQLKLLYTIDFTILHNYKL